MKCNRWVLKRTTKKHKFIGDGPKEVMQEYVDKHLKRHGGTVELCDGTVEVSIRASTEPYGYTCTPVIEVSFTCTKCDSMAPPKSSPIQSEYDLGKFVQNCLNSLP